MLTSEVSPTESFGASEHSLWGQSHDETSPKLRLAERYQWLLGSNCLYGEELDTVIGRPIATPDARLLMMTAALGETWCIMARLFTLLFKVYGATRVLVGFVTLISIGCTVMVAATVPVSTPISARRAFTFGAEFHLWFW